MRSRFAVLLAACALTCAAGARADSWVSPGGPYTFKPEVPISALGRPASWLDPSHFHFSTSLSVGTGFGGTQGLQVTSMSYQFRAPMTLNVSMGNAWGGAGSQNGTPFLEGVDFAYRPLQSMMIRIQYHDFRSQMQNPYFSSDPSLGLWGR